MLALLPPSSRPAPLPQAAHERIERQPEDKRPQDLVEFMREGQSELARREFRQHGHVQRGGLAARASVRLGGAGRGGAGRGGAGGGAEWGGGWPAVQPCQLEEAVYSMLGGRAAQQPDLDPSRRSRCSLTAGARPARFAPVARCPQSAAERLAGGGHPEVAKKVEEKLEQERSSGSLEDSVGPGSMDEPRIQ